MDHLMFYLHLFNYYFMNFKDDTVFFFQENKNKIYIFHIIIFMVIGLNRENENIFIIACCGA